MAKEIAACFLLGLILAVTAIFFIPPELPHVTLVSLNVSKLNITSYHNMSGYVDMQFEVYNSNFLTALSYDDMYCSLYHGKCLLAWTMHPGFFQRARETKPINFTVYLPPVTTAREDPKVPPYHSFEAFDVEVVTFIKWFGSSKSVRVAFACIEVPADLLVTARGHGR